MADPFSASRLVEILKAEGLVVHEYRSWRTHNRNHKGAWGPINGVMIHHTVTRGTSSSVALCYNGHSSLPGPLCHGVIDKAGEVWLVGNGRANHAGLGDDDVLDAVIDERDAPGDNEANTDGNARFYGFEAVNMGDGEDPWPEEQLLAIEKVSAAICRAYGWDAESVIGHLEWQPGKVDPRGFSMDWMRDRIRKRLGGAPGGQEDSVTPEDIDKIADKVVDRLLTADRIAVPWESENTHNQVGNAMESWWRQTHRTDLNVQEIKDLLTSGGVDVDALAERVVAQLGGDIADVIADKLAERLRD